MSVGAVNKSTGDRIPTAGMPAIDDALDLTSVNPVQNAVITAALANKQDKTDNSLQTTDKTVVGAVNELKSGLTNVNVALSVPDGTGKNVLPMTLAAVKAANTVGTWSDNAYTVYDVTFTVQTDGDDNVVGITSNGTATHGVLFYLYKKGSDASFPTNDYILTGCADGGSNSTWRIIGVEVESGSNVYFGDSGSGATFNTTATKHLNQLYIEVFSGVNINNKTFYPMVRPATITDPTFAPYIPSVESRIEAVENKQMVKTSETVTLNANGISRLSLTLSQGRIVYAVKIEGGNNAYLVLPYCTTVDGGVWAVKVVNPDDMSPIASAEVTIAYGYLP